MTRACARPGRSKASRRWDPEKLIARSLTGELVWNVSAGFVTVDTSRTQAVIGFLNSGPHKLATVTLDSSIRFGAVYVTARDADAPITSSRRLLVTAVGPARNTGMEYETTAQPSPLGTPYRRLREAGKGPAVLEAVTGRLEIRSDVADQLKAWSLDIVGNRVRRIPLTTASGSILLNMQAAHKTAYYEFATE